MHKPKMFWLVALIWKKPEKDFSLYSINSTS
jgi:hypothetical protein